MKNYYDPSYCTVNPFDRIYSSSQPAYQPFMAQPVVAPPQTQPLMSLAGKIVENEDVVRATEVPIGGYGVFPRADLSEIYFKSWNNNGTTNIITYKPVVPSQDVAPTQEENVNKILQKIENLEEKLNGLLAGNTASASVPKKEVKLNEY